MHGENDDPKWWTLDSLMKLNGSCFSSPSQNPRLQRLISTLRCVCVSDHTFIDILKIDIEGGEFDALTAFVNSHAQGDLPIGQLQIEIHAREGHERFDRGGGRLWKRRVCDLSGRSRTWCTSTWCTAHDPSWQR